MTLLVSTTQRCGSTWLCQILSRATGHQTEYINCTKLGFRIDSETNADAFAALCKLSLRGQDRILKTHDIPSKDFDCLCRSVPGLKIFTISRDFRDIVISRYFYYRYYWHTNRALGALPPNIERFFGICASLSDRESLKRLCTDPLILKWAVHWVAFELPFTSRSAIRLSYQGLVSEREISSVQQFLDCSIPKMPSFKDRQTHETSQTAREGPYRFNREGRVDQWKEWFDTNDLAEIKVVLSKAVQSTGKNAEHFKIF